MQPVGRKLAGLFVKYDIIDVEMRKNYEYVIEIIIERLISYISILFISLVFDKLIPGFLFVSFFVLLRRYTGGYHAKSFAGCYFGSVFLLLTVIGLGEISFSSALMGALIIISIITVLAVGTVKHLNMNYSLSELRESKRAARYILLLEMIIIVSMYILGASQQCLRYMCMGIIMCAAGIVVAKIFKQEDCK